MSLAPPEIEQVVAELSGWVGGVVQKAFVPREQVLLLELRLPGRSGLLQCSVESGRARLHLVSDRPPSPQEALAFQQHVRAHLVGRALTGVTHPAPRRVELVFADQEGERRVHVEVSGRQGNLVLTSASGTIIALGGPSLPPGRGLAAGKPYVAPEEPAASGPPSRYALEPAGRVSPAIERDYAARDQEANTRAWRSHVEAPLKQKRDRLRRTLAKVRVEADRTAAAEQHRVAGELLKVNLGRVPRGAKEVRLIDYTTGEPQEIAVALKPELSAAANLAWHFRQYRRLSQGSQRAAARLAELSEQVRRVEAELEALTTLTPAQIAERVPGPASAMRPAPIAQAERLPYKEFTGSGGRTIRVGKGAVANDTLSFKHARPHDLWLHARGLPGSHVVVSLERGEAPPTELLLDACALAVHFSSAKGQDRVEVSYLLAKYLRKVKGVPGAVTYSQEKTLRYAHQADRIARLLASREG